MKPPSTAALLDAILDGSAPAAECKDFFSRCARDPELIKNYAEQAYLQALLESAPEFIDPQAFGRACQRKQTAARHSRWLKAAAGLAILLSGIGWAATRLTSIRPSVPEKEVPAPIVAAAAEPAVPDLAPPAPTPTAEPATPTATVAQPAEPALPAAAAPLETETQTNKNEREIAMKTNSLTQTLAAGIAAASLLETAPARGENWTYVPNYYSTGVGALTNSAWQFKCGGTPLTLKTCMTNFTPGVLDLSQPIFGTNGTATYTLTALDGCFPADTGDQHLADAVHGLVMTNSITYMNACFYHCTNLLADIANLIDPQVDYAYFYKPFIGDIGVTGKLTFAADCKCILGYFQGCGISEVHLTGDPSGCMFWGCEKLRNVVFDYPVYKIDAYCFDGCTNLANISSNGWAFATNIASSAFFQCKNLQLGGGDASLPVETLAGSQIFMSLGNNLGPGTNQCLRFTSRQLRNIPAETFRYSGVTALEFAGSITNLDGAAFLGCQRLGTIWFQGPAPLTINSHNHFLWAGNFVDSTNRIIYCSKRQDGWKDNLRTSIGLTTNTAGGPVGCFGSWTNSNNTYWLVNKPSPLDPQGTLLTFGQ